MKPVTLSKASGNQTIEVDDEALLHGADGQKHSNLLVNLSQQSSIVEIN